jgi:hypothetical protein
MLALFAALRESKLQDGIAAGAVLFAVQQEAAATGSFLALPMDY